MTRKNNQVMTLELSVCHQSRTAGKNYNQDFFKALVTYEIVQGIPLDNLFTVLDFKKNIAILYTQPLEYNKLCHLKI